MQIPNLSNRSLAFLLLIIIACVAYAGIQYVFFMNIGSISFIVKDGTTYDITLKRANIELGSLACQESCGFSDIPVGEYQYIATASGRIAVNNTVKVWRGQTMVEILESKLDVLAGTVTPADKTLGIYEVRSNPIRLIDTRSNKVLTRSGNAIWYSMNSMSYGYFLMFDANKTINIYDLNNGKIRTMNWYLSELPTHIKRLANRKFFVLYTKDRTYLSDIETNKLEEVRLYDDIEASPTGSMIALIRAKSTDKKQFLNLQNEPGDVLLDIGVAGSPKTLQTNISDVASLFWNGTFGIQKSNGDRQLLNIK